MPPFSNRPGGPGALVRRALHARVPEGDPELRLLRGRENADVARAARGEGGRLPAGSGDVDRGRRGPRAAGGGDTDVVPGGVGRLPVEGHAVHLARATE